MNTLSQTPSRALADGTRRLLRRVALLALAGVIVGVATGWVRASNFDPVRERVRAQVSALAAVCSPGGASARRGDCRPGSALAMLVQQWR